MLFGLVECYEFSDLGIINFLLDEIRLFYIRMWYFKEDMRSWGEMIEGCKICNINFDYVLLYWV